MILICYTKLVILEIVAIILRFKKRVLNKGYFQVFCTSYPTYYYESYLVISILFYMEIQTFNRVILYQICVKNFVDTKDLVKVCLRHFMFKFQQRNTLLHSLF